jgi:hypothetical protein
MWVDVRDDARFLLDTRLWPQSKPALGFRFRETGCLVETGVESVRSNSHHHHNDNKELS